MEKKEVKLICRAVKYYTPKDEDAFFEWLNKILSIVEIVGWKNELHLYFESIVIPDIDLYDLMAVFYRYKIDMTQLKIFLNDQNKSWFFDDKEAYWHKQVFGS